MKLTPERRILRAKSKLLEKSPFYSFIVMNMVCQQHESKSLPTMAVNEYGHLFYNPKFVETMKMEELVAVLAHEASHVATLTFQRLHGRDMQIWNIATDIAINYMLVCDQFVLPKGVLIPNLNGDIKIEQLHVNMNCKDLCAEEIYDELMKNQHIQKMMKEKEDFKKFLEKFLEENGFSDKHIKGNKDPDGNPVAGDDSKMSQDKNAKRWRQILSKALLSGRSRLDSRTNSALERELGMISESQIPWRAYLQRFVTASVPADVTMRRPGRKSQGCGCYLPSIIREGLDVIIGVDMSGSISEEDWTAFMSEIIAITKGFAQINVKLIPWASQVEEKDIADFSRQNIDQIKDWRSTCCGGTTLSCFADYLESSGTVNPNAIHIIFTDGYVESDFKLPKGKTLVVLTNTENMSMFRGKCECISIQN